MRRKSKYSNNAGTLGLFSDNYREIIQDSVKIDVDNNLESKNVTTNKACYLPKVENSRFNEIAERILTVQGAEALGVILKERGEILKYFV